ncbi:alpha/beta fold hydrolase [Glutamicibacter sp. NPDC087344]|uniref:alpha/beta fold hydrolase n=1 Tax=Glutamicibacter sp. NPDC087344 TaxID=3363994 RepID=UPI003804331A
MSDSYNTTAQMIWLVSAGLIVTGLLNFTESGEVGIRRFPTWTSGAVLVAAGVILLLWRGATLPALALAASIALAIGGLLQFGEVLTGHHKPIFRGILTALTGIFGAVLTIFWPKLSLWVLGIAFGAWLVIRGARYLLTALSNGNFSAPRWLRKTVSLGMATLAIIGLVAVLGLGAVTAWLHSTGQNTVNDAFYLAPANVPEAPGQLIRAEPLSKGMLPETNAWRMLYTTTNSDGGPAVASGILTLPKNAMGELPVISWANGTKGVAARCGLSQSATPFDDGPASARADMLAHGWAVVATDYVGLGTTGPHPYLVPEAEAHAVLDATRAARQLSPTVSKGTTLSNQTVIWGHSQGGHAALASAQAAPEYAPEFEVLGVAAMAPASDLKQLAVSVADSTAGKVISSYMATSWDELYPELGIRENLPHSIRKAVDRISKNCFYGTEVLTSLAQSSQLFEPVFTAAEMTGELGARLEDNSAPYPADVPVFIAQGAADVLVLPQMQQGFFANLCAANSNAAYKEYEGLDHMPLVGADSALNADLVAFSNSVFGGTAQFPSNGERCS